MNMMRYDAVIFDIDGTLWDACATSAKGLTEGMHTLGLPGVISEEDVRGISGKPCNDGMRLLFGDMLNKRPDAIQVLNDYEMKAIQREGGKFYKDAVEAMPTLSSLARLFLVSTARIGT